MPASFASPHPLEKVLCDKTNGSCCLLLASLQGTLVPVVKGDCYFQVISHKARMLELVAGRPLGCVLMGACCCRPRTCRMQQDTVVPQQLLVRKPAGSVDGACPNQPS